MTLDDLERLLESFRMLSSDKQERVAAAMEEASKDVLMEFRRELRDAQRFAEIMLAPDDIGEP